MLDMTGDARRVIILTGILMLTEHAVRRITQAPGQ